MKQVKYRLWCNNKKEWEKDEWHLTSDGIIIDTKRNIEMKKETHFLNQFTGLFDKQGVEIYDGDILGGIIGGCVVWIEKEARFGIDVCGEIGECTFNDFMQCDLKVIGNIYDNPELLEAKA